MIQLQSVTEETGSSGGCCHLGQWQHPYPPDFGTTPTAAPALLTVGGSEVTPQIQPWDMGHFLRGWATRALSCWESPTPTPPVGPPPLGKKGEDFREFFPQIGKPSVFQRDLDLSSTCGTGREWEYGGY